MYKTVFSVHEKYVCAYDPKKDTKTSKVHENKQNTMYSVTKSYRL